jgi:hypothetical protein
MTSDNLAVLYLDGELRQGVLRGALAATDCPADPADPAVFTAGEDAYAPTARATRLDHTTHGCLLHGQAVTQELPKGYMSGV